MSLLSTLAGGTIAQPIDAIGNVFDKLFTSDEERAKAEFVLEKLRMDPVMLQAEINKLEAQHRSIFVAGWRPFIGWVCGIALAWHFMLYDLAVWYTRAYAPDVEPPALAGTESLIALVVPLLGLGAYRTVEKLGGKAK